MLQRLFLAAVLLVLIQMHGQPGNRLRQDSHTGVYSSHLHGGAFIHRLARGGLTEEEAVTAAVGAVGGLIPGME